MITPLNLAYGVAQSTLQHGFMRHYAPNLTGYVQSAFGSLAYAYGYSLADKLYPILVDKIDLPSKGLYGIAARISLKLVIGNMFGSTFHSNIHAIRAWIYPVQSKCCQR